MIISNTTPISNFLKLGRIDILKSLFPRIHIPPAVKQELDDYFSENTVWNACLQKDYFIIQKIRSLLTVQQLVMNLHIGEAEAICLYLEQKADLFLMDDKDGRKCAELNKIQLTGTIGLLLMAKRKNLIESVRRPLEDLRTNHCFWVSEAMIHRAMQLANEKPH